MQAGVQAATARTVAPPLARVLAGLAEAAELLGVAEVADLAAETAGRLRDLRLEVAVVVGEFKRGKSSLINALVGREVLPVDVLPLTAVPTVLEHGEEGLVVQYDDGHQEQHRLDRLAKFVTEDANPGNRLRVAQVTARLHTPLLDAGVRLVDTPGVGSVYAHNTRATDAYLPSLGRGGAGHLGRPAQPQPNTGPGSRQEDDGDAHDSRQCSVANLLRDRL